MPDDPRPVFVYGTLTEPDRVDAILDEWWDAGGAILEGCHRVDGAYPTLAPGGETVGRLLVTPALVALDAYEGVAAGPYVRVAVPLSTGGDRGDEAPGASACPSDAGAVWLYVGEPAALGAPARWPGDGPFLERVRSYLAAAAVVVRPTGGARGRPADR